MNYQETLNYLFSSLPVFEKEGATAYKPGLERTQAFNRHLGCPDKLFHTIHVAGTNGKGSVSHMLASILQSGGYNVGLFTSPHLRDFRERIKVNGKPISEQNVVEFVEQNQAKMEELQLSFFEMTTGMALDHFGKSDVEVAIIETGLGGRLDSTNIINPILSIITNIGFDHMSYLGDTLEKIAAEKSGIIKQGVPVVIGETDPFSSEIFLNKANECGSKIRFADQLFRCVETEHNGDRNAVRMERIDDQSRITIETDLLGDYQKKNVATVLTAAKLLNHDTMLNLSRRAIMEGMRNAARDTGLCGRWEILSRQPLTVCDTGHNEHGLRIVCRQILKQKFEKLYIVFGVANDKDISKILPLLPPTAHYIFTQAATKRALPAAELASLAANAGLRGEITNTVAEAVARARSLASAEDMIFIGGSTFVVAEIPTT